MYREKYHELSETQKSGYFDQPLSPVNRGLSSMVGLGGAISNLQYATSGFAVNHLQLTAKSTLGQQFASQRAFNPQQMNI